MPSFMFLLVKNAAKNMLSHFQFEIVRTFSLLWLLASQQCRQDFKAAPLPMLPTQGETEPSATRVRACPGAIAGSSQSDTRTTPFKNGASTSPGLPVLLGDSPCWVHHPSAAFISIQHSIWRSYPCTDFGINRKASLTSCHHWGWEKTLIYLNFLQDRYFQSSIVKGKLHALSQR